MPTAKKSGKRQGVTGQSEKEPKWQCPGPIQDMVVYLATTTQWTPSQIFEKVSDDLAKDKKNKLIMPSKRTVERMVKHYCSMSKPGDSDTWSVADSEPEDAALILKVLADVMLFTHGEKPTFTRQEAKWVLKIGKMLPEAYSLTQIWLLAKDYVVAETRHQETGHLDAYLAFKPWKNNDRYRTYEYAVNHKWIPPHDNWIFDGLLTPTYGMSALVDKPLSLSFLWWGLKRERDRRFEVLFIGERVPGTPLLRRVPEGDPGYGRGKLHRIWGKAPELARRIHEEFRAADRRADELEDEWGRRIERDSETEAEPEDIAAMDSVWQELDRLLESHEEGKK